MNPIFRINHGCAGEPYTGKIIASNERFADYTFLDIKLPDTLAFSIDIADGTLSGIAPDPGEYDITLAFYRSGKKPLKEEQGNVTLLIVPNPKSMWKELPTPDNAPYQVPNAQCSSILAAGFMVTAASKRGRSHAHVGSFRDDHYCVKSNGEWLISVVADGAGSAKYSRRGAELVCETASTYLHDVLGTGLGNPLERAVYQAIDQGNTEQLQILFIKILGMTTNHALAAIKKEIILRADLASELKDYSTTALITVTRKIGTLTLCASYAVGDGAVTLYRADGPLLFLGPRDSGEYTGQTRFLDEHTTTQAEIAARTRVDIIEHLTGILVMTDGVSDPFFETDHQLNDKSAWDNLWQALHIANAISGKDADKQLLAWLDFWSKGNHDDRTLIILTQDTHG